VEHLGYDALWVIEDCFLSGGLTMAATALAVTSRISVGIGLLPATVRNPAILAMELATLARMHPGRFEAALGHGVREWMQQIGALPPRRLGALSETVQTIKGLLSGDTVTTTGDHVHLSSVALEAPVTHIPPVLIGTTGPKGLALAGRVADGALLPEGCSPAFVRWAVDHMAAGPLARCVVYAWMNLDDDLGRAVDRLLPAVDRWLDWDLFPEPRRAAGVAVAPPPGDPARRALVPQLSVCGDAGQCAQYVRDYARAGADTLVLVPVATDAVRQIEAFAREVLPRLASEPESG
jgi:alkanesulfonate monooxygenase SsuD/methylene tetrahydromethanopterin reductase-like flavin-dependent oxidoreductase (luciferase family)